MHVRGLVDMVDQLKTLPHRAIMKEHATKQEPEALD